MKEIDIDKIVAEFEIFCLKNHTAAQASNSRVANKFAKKIINCYLQLKEFGKTNELSKLLKSENENVPCLARVYTRA